MDARTTMALMAALALAGCGTAGAPDVARPETHAPHSSHAPKSTLRMAEPANRDTTVAAPDTAAVGEPRQLECGRFRAPPPWCRGQGGR